MLKNGEVVLTSERREGKGGAENGAESVLANAPLDERYERLKRDRDEDYFVLTAGNHQVIGKSKMYASVAGIENGIASVKENGPVTLPKIKPKLGN